MSVVDRIANLAVSPEKEEARDRLLEAERALGEPGSGSVGEARLAKLRALVDLDWYAAAAKFADPATYKEELVVLAYSYYRLGKIGELRELLGRHGGESAPVGAKLSLAQAEYKAGNLQQAKRQFESCLSEVSEEDAADIAVNLGAINAIQGITNGAQSAETGTFDEAFNLASALLVRGNVETALQVLQHANGLAEEEDDRHSAVAQAAYAHLLSGNTEEALKLLETVTSSTPLSQLPLALRIVVANNRLAATYEGGDLAAAHKALLSYDDFAKSGIELNADQRQVVARNELKLLARVGISSAPRRAARHLDLFPNDVEPLAVAYRSTKPMKIIRRLAQTEDRAAKVCLSAAQGERWVYPSHEELREGDFGQLAIAVDSLSSQGASKASKGAPKNHEAYFASLGIPELAEAGQRLLSPTVEVTSDLLDSVAKRVSSVNAESLNFAIPQSAQPSGHTLTKPLSHKKRSGKRKLPESYDPKRSPDPERWLAKQDRSDYKPKKKKTSQATQGAANVPDEPVAPPASQVVGAKTKKKSKKKGKK